MPKKLTYRHRGGGGNHRVVDRGALIEAERQDRLAYEQANDREFQADRARRAAIRRAHAERRAARKHAAIARAAQRASHG